MRIGFLLVLAVPLAGQECASEIEHARQAYHQKDYTLAARRFERAVVVCPGRGGLLLDLAKAQFMAQQPQAADRTLAELLKLEPRNAAALKLKGDAQYLMGNAVEAERLLLGAIEADPKNPEPRYALGRIYYQQVRLQQSLEQFRKVLGLDPRSYRTYDNMGLAFEGLTDIPRALESYEKALAIVHKDHPEYDSVYANMADLLYRQSDYKRSFQYAAEAANRNPNSARNFFLTGRALARMERWELAEKWLKQAVLLDPSLPAARYQLAQVFRSLGKIDEAERELQAFESVSTGRPARP